MRDPSRILQVLHDRGRRGLGVNKIYKHLCNTELALAAWAQVYDNDGALTPGTDPDDTAEGVSMDYIEETVGLLRSGRYRPKAVRRTYIPKKHGGERPLGLPGFRDKLVGQMVRMLLEAYYEPQFSEHSWGYRPGRSVAGAVEDIQTWKGTTWWIEGDIADCFGSIDHEVMIGILAESIDDDRFLELVRRFLTAGYMEDWRWHPTEVGAPQGGVLSPILSNVYLHRLDQFVEHELIPEYTRGARRAGSRVYGRLTMRIKRASQLGQLGRVRELEGQRRAVPSYDLRDPGFRRLRYARFADDHLLGFIGPKAEAEAIRDRLAVFLRDELKLSLSLEKTHITHARSKPARFLGFDLIVRHSVDGHHRQSNGMVNPRVPGEVIREKTQRHRHGGRAVVREELLGKSDDQIIAILAAELRGLTEFYRLATNASALHRVATAVKRSMLKTLAAKHRSTTVKMHARYGTHVSVGGRDYRCYEATYTRRNGTGGLARFGPIKLTWERKVTTDQPPWRPELRIREVVKRLKRSICEVCDRAGRVSVHQIRSLTDLDRWDQALTWVKTMRRKQRLTLFACDDCHDYVHHSATA